MAKIFLKAPSAPKTASLLHGGAGAQKTHFLEHYVVPWNWKIWGAPHRKILKPSVLLGMLIPDNYSQSRDSGLVNVENQYFETIAST